MSYSTTYLLKRSNMIQIRFSNDGYQERTIEALSGERIENRPFAALEPP